MEESIWGTRNHFGKMVSGRGREDSMTDASFLVPKTGSELLKLGMRTKAKE